MTRKFGALSFQVAAKLLLAFAVGHCTFALSQPANTVPIPNGFGTVFNDAKNWSTQRNANTPSGVGAGQTVVPGAQATVNATTGQTEVPHYTGTTVQPQSGLFSGGQGATIAPGMQRTTDCATLPATGTGFTRQECEAINFMQNAPSVRPQFTVNRNEAMIANTKSGVLTPSTALGTTNATLQGTYSQCTPTTVTSPITYKTEICTDTLSGVENKCSVGQQIVVDAHHLYQCAEQLQNLSTATCRVPQVVEVDHLRNFDCTQSQKQLGTTTCNKDLIVEVNYMDSCSIGDIVMQKDVPFGYVYASGPDYYTYGGAARAHCNYLTQDQVDMKWYFGTLRQGAAGSGADYNPPPNSDLLTMNGSAIVYTYEPVDRFLGMGGFNVADGAYNLYVGAGSGCFRSPSATINTPAAEKICNITLIFGYNFAVPFIDENGNVTPANCGNGPLLRPEGNCLEKRVIVTFMKPHKTYTVTDRWQNACLPLEARQ
jgi:hypothetical protein